MNSLMKLWRWIDNNLLTLLLASFIFIIPLYPKFPLRVVNYTYVAIRVDDLYVGLLYIVFLLQLFRKKVRLNTLFLKLFILFWLAVFASFVVGAYVSHTLVYKQLAFFHSLRRVEYMGIFFVVLSSILSPKLAKKLIDLLVAVLLIVCIYGIGQKFFGWPAVQTMNPEYAKGYLLFLTSEARISATFSGHYDLAAYLVFLIPLVLGLYFAHQKKWYYLTFLLAFGTLVLTAARSSFVAYLITIIGFLLVIKKPKHLIFILILTAVLTLLNKNLSSRIARTFQVKQIFVNEQTGQVVVPQRISTKEVPAGSFYIPIKRDHGSPTVDDSSLAFERIRADLRDEYAKNHKILTNSEEIRLAATIAAGLKPINTVVSDISFATRLQVEWPRAIGAFLKNPLFGTGPSSITESTDNDFLRMLGEVGLAGGLSFLAIFMAIVKYLSVHLPPKSDRRRSIYLGFLFGIGALVINAGYIDVFEASKVAYYFWLSSALMIASLAKNNV
ncbi:O-antigen ligase family protein [Candidatus Roizmanbacteria bacterium]|nr:O-antigen ligase family protein [Candidatus Roizmanbacteria bacterium]